MPRTKNTARPPKPPSTDFDTSLDDFKKKMKEKLSPSTEKKTKSSKPRKIFPPGKKNPDRSCKSAPKEVTDPDY
jgi:hypothetical protein